MCVLCHRYSHWFDGMAMMHRFYVKDGDVTYNSSFLRSDSYTKNSEKDRIVVSEFGTIAMPDPCKNIFARFFSRFKLPRMCASVSSYIFSEIKLILVLCRSDSLSLGSN